MERKAALLALVDHARKLGADLANRLSDEERTSSGTYERWAPKDVFAHVAEWLRRGLAKLDIADGPMPFVNADDIESMNHTIFAKHAGKSWSEVAAFFAETFEEVSRRVEAMSADDLERDREFADGSKRTAWRMVAGHALMHLSGHLAIVYDRLEDGVAATALEESAAGMLLTLDDTPEWVGTVTYNLACHYSLKGNASRAIGLLREALGKNPGLVEWSRKDSDLAGIRGDPDFGSVYPGI